MDQQGNVIFVEKPKLRQPYMVCGISGRVDGGEAATGSVRYLRRKLEAITFADMPIARFHVFQVPGQVSLGPHITIEDGIIKEHRFPQNQFFYWVNPSADHDLILFLGTEPNLNWEEYAGAILDVAQEFAVTRIYRLGGVLDNSPHTREPRVSCICSSPELKEEMDKYGVQYMSYEGPGTFGTSLHYLCQNRRIQMVSMTAGATYYPEFNIAISYNPKAIRALVRRLNHLLDVKLELSELDEAVKDLHGKLASVARHNAEFAAYIKQLEKDFVEVKHEELLNISAEEAVEIAEELLKDENKGQ